MGVPLSWPVHPISIWIASAVNRRDQCARTAFVMAPWRRDRRLFVEGVVRPLIETATAKRAVLEHLSDI